MWQKYSSVWNNRYSLWNSLDDVWNIYDSIVLKPLAGCQEHNSIWNNRHSLWNDCSAVRNIYDSAWNNPLATGNILLTMYQDFGETGNDSLEILLNVDTRTYTSLARFTLGVQLDRIEKLHTGIYLCQSRVEIH